MLGCAFEILFQNRKVLQFQSWKETENVTSVSHTYKMFYHFREEQPYNERKKVCSIFRLPLRLNHY